jgi:hypothetical protein
MTYQSESLNRSIRATNGPEGIGGWLILPILSLFGTSLWTGYNLSSLLTQWTGIKAIILGTTAETAAMRIPVALSTLAGVAIIVIAVLCLYRIFTKSPAVPRMMTIFYISLIAVTLVEALADHMIVQTTGGSLDADTPKSILQAVVAAAIWIPYFHRSRRVANTFRTREAQADKQIGEIFS